MSGQERQDLGRRPRGLTLEQAVEFMFDRAERNDRGCWICHLKPRPGDNPQTSFQGKDISIARLVLWWKIGRPLRSLRSSRPEYARHTCGEKRCINPAHLAAMVRINPTRLAARRRRVAGKKIVEAYREGATLQQIEDRYGVSITTSHIIIHRLAPGLMRGKGGPRRLVPSERDRRILENRRTGMTLEEIGELEGISRQRVYAVLKRWRATKFENR